MRVRRFRMLAGIVALGVALTLAIGSAGPGSGSALGAATTLTVLSGDVAVRHGAGGSFAPARDGEVIAPGDAIQTAAGARAVITYFEGSTVTIEPLTTLVVDEAEAIAGGGTIVSMTQLVGRTWHVVTKLATGASRYEVRTPASTASVRGTEFEVSSDADATTVTTTEGEVVAQVADAGQGGRVVEVPVAAGTTQTQRRDAPPAPARAAPRAERTVSVTVAASSSLVVDPLGRTNGVTRDGKLVAQTPGAQVRREGDSVVVELPDMPDGRVAARTDGPAPRRDGAVTVRVEERGRELEVRDTLRSANGEDRSGFEVRRGEDGKTGARVLGEDESDALPRGTATPSRRGVSATPEPARRPDDGRGEGKGQGQGQGQAPGPGGFVPPSALPTLPTRPTLGSGAAVPGGPGGPPADQGTGPSTGPNKNGDSGK